MKIVILPGTAEPALEPGSATAAPADGHGFALGGDDGRWLLVDVSSEVAGQLLGGELNLSPWAGAAAVLPLLLTDARRGHLEGLHALIGGMPVDLYATPSVFEDFTAQLQRRPPALPGCPVHWQLLPVAAISLVDEEDKLRWPLPTVATAPCAMTDQRQCRRRNDVNPMPRLSAWLRLVCWVVVLVLKVAGCRLRIRFCAD